MAEFDNAHWDKIGWQHKGRWEEINGILLLTRDRDLPELSVHERNITQGLLQRPSWPISNLGERVLDLYYSNVAKSIENAYRINRRHALLSLLVNAVANPADNKEVLNLDYVLALQLSALGGLIGGVVDLADLIQNPEVEQRERYTRAMHEGNERGVEEVLELVRAGNMPTKRYSRDYFVGRGEITPDPRIGAVISYPSRFEGVEVKFQFDPNIEEALIFFKVDELPPSA